MKSFSIRLISTVALTIALITTAHAGVIRDDKSESDFEFLFAPYLWGVSLDGDSNGAELDASFSDILSALNVAVSLHTELHHGKWFAVVDPTYLSLEMDVPTPGLRPNLEADVDIWLVEVWGGYKLFENWSVIRRRALPGPGHIEFTVAAGTGSS